MRTMRDLWPLIKNHEMNYRGKEMISLKLIEPSTGKKYYFCNFDKDNKVVVRPCDWGFPHLKTHDQFLQFVAQDL